MKYPIYVIILFCFSLISCNRTINDIINSENATFVVFTYDENGCPSGTGSGFFIEKSGIGITNFHVLAEAAKAIIVTTDNSKFEIESVLYSDSERDIVKFKISNKENRNFQTMELAENDPKRGDNIYCISSPLGYDNTLTNGIISAIRSDKSHGKIIQFTAPISPGSSGGPILNDMGEVVGLATFNKRYGQNLNFGICVNSEILNLASSDSLNNTHQFILNNNTFLILNIKAGNDPFTTFNAIKFTDSSTICYFTYTRLNISNNDEGWGFWFELNKKEQGFYLKDINKGDKYFIKSSTIGCDRSNQTKVQLAKTVKYSVTLPKIRKNIDKIILTEGIDSRSSKWNVISLNEYRNLSKFNIEKYQLNYAMAALAQSDYTEAENIFFDLLQQDPSNVSALNSLGIIYFTVKNYDESLKFFNKAIYYNPRVEESYVNRHHVYCLKKEFNLALKDINKAIEISPSYPEYYIYRSNIYLNLGETKMAIVDKEKADKIIEIDNTKNGLSFQ